MVIEISKTDCIILLGYICPIKTPRLKYLIIYLKSSINYNILDHVSKSHAKTKKAPPSHN